MPYTPKKTSKVHSAAWLEERLQLPETTPYLVGLDEVGRGCLAGPVVVACSVWEHQRLAGEGAVSASSSTWWNQIGDSKKLTRLQRKSLYQACLKELQLTPPSFDLGLGTTSPKSTISGTKPRQTFSDWEKLPAHYHTPQDAWKLVGVFWGISTHEEIDRWNIWECCQLASRRALEQIPPGIKPRVGMVAVDGKLPFSLQSPFCQAPQMVLVGGDSLSRSIGLASIMAKEWRDGLMEHWDPFEPLFGHKNHKGYGTSEHRAAILKSGAGSLHRQSFLSKILQGHANSPT